MQIKFWNPPRNYKRHKKELDEAYFRVMESGNLVLGYGEDVEKFEKDFAKFTGVRHAIACGAGTQALYLAYRGLIGLGSNLEIIVPSHTFIATIDQIVAIGAKPVLVDIGEDGLIDPDEIRKAITEDTVAIVPVHLEGKICNMPKILEIAEEYNLLVIEDAAQAAGANIMGKRAGSWGDAGCFSMFPAKIYGAYGNMGCVTTNDDKLAERLRLMRCNWNIGKNQSMNVEYGTNMEPDVLQSAFANVKMKYLEDYLKRRQEIADMYYEGLKDLPILLPYRQNGRVYQDFVIRVEQGRGELIKHLEANGIGILGHNLRPNHHYNTLGLTAYLPKTDEYISQQIRIPCNQDTTDEEVKEVIKVIRKYYDKK